MKHENTPSFYMQEVDFDRESILSRQTWKPSAILCDKRSHNAPLLLLVMFAFMHPFQTIRRLEHEVTELRTQLATEKSVMVAVLLA